MTDAADTVADIRRAVELLGSIDDPAATRVGLALDSWLRGTSLEASLGLLPGWRQYVEQKARDRALAALLSMRPGMKGSVLADLILEGLELLDGTGVRPDGADGHIHDLKRAGCSLSHRRWRQLIAEVGQRSC